MAITAVVIDQLIEFMITTLANYATTVKAINNDLVIETNAKSFFTNSLNF